MVHRVSMLPSQEYTEVYTYTALWVLRIGLPFALNPPKPGPKIRQDYHPGKVPEYP